MTVDVAVNPEAAARYAEAVGQFAVTLRIGPMARPLPTTLEGLRRRLDASYAGLMTGAPTAIDDGLLLEFRDGGAIRVAAPIHGTARSTAKGRFVLHAPPGEPQRAARMLADGLDFAERYWLEKKRETWRCVRRCERVASQLLGMHVAACTNIARVAEKRYVGDPTADHLRSDRYGPEFASLGEALIRLAKARERVNLDVLRRDKSVLQVAALGAMGLALLHAEKASASVETAFKSLEGLASDAAKREGEATIKYLATMRELAAEHPILVALQHHTEGLYKDGKAAKSYTTSDLQVDVRTTIKDARKALASLRKSATKPVVPAIPVDVQAMRGNGANGHAAAEPEPLTIVAMVRLVAGASATSVWKLPFFLDRALEHLLPAERRLVLGIKQAAREHADDAVMGDVLTLVGCEAIAALAPAAGPIGVAVAVAWNLVSLAGSVKEYDEVKILYDATIDPSVLLLGERHDPADPSGVIMDLVGLIL